MELESSRLSSSSHTERAACAGGEQVEPTLKRIFIFSLQFTASKVKEVKRLKRDKEVDEKHWGTKVSQKLGGVVCLCARAGGVVAGSAACPRHRGEVDLWECCSAATTVRQSAGCSASPASPPAGPAAPGHLLPHTAHAKTHEHTHTNLRMAE